MATHEATDWRLSGTVVVACNCAYGCPCNFNALPTHGDCEGGWTWHVAEGHHGDVRLDGLNFSMYADWPAAIHDGNGDALLLIDERADERQRQTLGRFLAGEIGGPWAILVNTFVRVHGPRFAPYEVALDEYRTRVRVGAVVELATEPIRNPVTGVEAHPRAVLPEGMIFKDGALVSSAAFRVSGDVEYDHTGNYAAVAPFDYRGG